MTAAPAYIVREVADRSSFARPLTIALGRNGSLAVSLGSLPTVFSGRSVSIDLSIVRSTALWNGDGWHANAGDIVPLNPFNRSVAAADTPTHAAYDGGYDYTLPILDQAQSTPHHQEDETGYTWAGRGFSLGYGTATAMRAQFVAGYSAGVGDDETSYGASDGHPTMWTRGKTIRLSASHGSALLYPVTP